jgi:hypothetical protein
MTCIVAAKGKDGVWMGSDSLGVDGARLSCCTRQDPKMFYNGFWLIGCTTSFRMIQLLMTSSLPQPPTKEEELFLFMITKFVPAIRKIFEDGGFSKKKDGQEEGGCFLVACNNHIFKIDGDFQVAENTLPFDACGCGEPYALGALYALQTVKATTKFKLQFALEAATEFSAGVRGPYTMLQANPFL